MKQKRTASINTLIRRREAWMKKLAQLGPVVRGSLCTAQRGNHTAHQLTVSVKGKTHTVYVAATIWFLRICPCRARSASGLHNRSARYAAPLLVALTEKHNSAGPHKLTHPVCPDFMHPGTPNLEPETDSGDSSPLSQPLRA